MTNSCSQNCAPPTGLSSHPVNIHPTIFDEGGRRQRAPDPMLPNESGDAVCRGCGADQPTTTRPGPYVLWLNAVHSTVEQRIVAVWYSLILRRIHARCDCTYICLVDMRAVVVVATNRKVVAQKPSIIRPTTASAKCQHKF